MQVLSMLLLFIKIIPLPLNKCSSFLLFSLILSSKSWSLQWIMLDNAILMLSSVSYSLIKKITFFIFWRVFTLFWISFVPVWIIIKLGFFPNSGSDIIDEVICCCSRVTSHFHWIIMRNFSPIYIHDHRITNDKNFFLYCWAICWLWFNQVNIIVVFMCCCFVVLFIRGGLKIGFFISASISSIIIRAVISYFSVYTTSYMRLSALNYSTTLMVK